MNLRSTFDQLFNPQQQAVAEILADKGGGSWSAQTQNGNPLILKGTTEVGKTVFYDMRTSRITGEAPALTVTDIAV